MTKRHIQGWLMIIVGAGVVMAMCAGLFMPEEISVRVALLLGIPGVLLAALGGLHLMIEGEHLAETEDLSPDGRIEARPRRAPHNNTRRPAH